MKAGDTLTGVLVSAAGLAVVLHARTFPSMPSQSVGPSLFPMLIGAALIVLGTILLASGFRQRDSRHFALDAWAGRPRMVINFALVVADLLFYALAVERLGFFITGFVFLGVLMLAFGVKRTWIVPLAAGVTLAMHYGFYTLLRVPLPWGLLERLAW